MLCFGRGGEDGVGLVAALLHGPYTVTQQRIGVGEAPHFLKYVLLLIVPPPLLSNLPPFQ